MVSDRKTHTETRRRGIDSYFTFLRVIGVPDQMVLVTGIGANPVPPTSRNNEGQVMCHAIGVGLMLADMSTGPATI